MAIVNITLFSFFFFFNDTATTEIYTLSLHDALPIYFAGEGGGGRSQRSVLFDFRVGFCGDVCGRGRVAGARRSEEHTSELQSHSDLVCRLLLEKKKPPSALLAIRWATSAVRLVLRFR